MSFFFLTVNASDHLEGFPEVSTTEIAEIYRGMVSVEKKMLTVKSSQVEKQKETDYLRFRENEMIVLSFQPNFLNPEKKSQQWG